MKSNKSKLSLIYVAGALLVFLLGSLILQRAVFIVFWGIVVLAFTSTIMILVRKMAFLEKQNNINLERFAVSIEHVNHILFDNVLEADITNNRLIGENATKLTALLQIPVTSSYSETIDAVSRVIVAEDYAEEYRKILSAENVLKTFEQGSNTLEYECIERSDGKNYRWIRAHYCIYKSNVTNCAKIISYVKNIEAEKRAYNRLIEKATTDPMTGLLNKISTKEIVTSMLHKYAGQSNMILIISKE